MRIISTRAATLRARDGEESDSREAWDALCRAYWAPLYAYVRREGHGAAEAQDLTQEFVARLLEPSSFYRFNGLFMVNAQNVAHVSEGGHQGGRQGFVWVSPDFDHWLSECGESFLLPEPANPNDRGHDRRYVQVHLGVGAGSYGNVMVGLYCQWHDGAMPGDWFGIGTTYGDFGLLAWYPSVKAKKEKDKARLMVKMTMDINQNYISMMEDEGGKPAAGVGCGTCHRGHLGPEPFVAPPDKKSTPPAAPSSK